MSSLNRAETGGGAQDRMSSFDVAALEKAFIEMLASLEGSPTPSPPAATSKSQKSTTVGKPQATNKLEIGLLRASDIAFPSGTNVYDHSPTAPFVLDENELRHVAPPSVVKINDCTKSDAEIDAFTRRSQIHTKEGPSIPSGADPLGDPTCIMSFGVDNGSSVAVTSGKTVLL